MKSMKANSKQSSTKSKATTTPMSLRSSQLSVQNTPKTPNETNNKEELVNIIRKVLKDYNYQYSHKCHPLYLNTI